MYFQGNIALGGYGVEATQESEPLNSLLIGIKLIWVLWGQNKLAQDQDGLVDIQKNLPHKPEYLSSVPRTPGGSSELAFESYPLTSMCTLWHRHPCTLSNTYKSHKHNNHLKSFLKRRN